MLQDTDNQISPMPGLAEHSSAIVVAYVRNNRVSAEEMPALIRTIHGALARLSNSGGEVEVTSQKPAVPIKRSITPDYIVCLEDGRQLKTLKRYLRSRYKLSPQAYRAKWGLPHDYPMVAPNYAAWRSQFAKKSGLGKKREPMKKNKR